MTEILHNSNIEKEIFSQITRYPLPQLDFIKLNIHMLCDEKEVQKQREDLLKDINNLSIGEINSLLKEGVNPNIKDEEGNTPSHKVVQVMIQTSANLSRIISKEIRGK